jgi:hypothetical protein
MWRSRPEASGFRPAASKGRWSLSRSVPGRAGVGADDDREGCRGQGEAGVDCEAGADAGGEPRRVNVGFGEVARPLCDDDCAP